MRAFAVSLLLLSVAGCATQAERAAQVQREVEDMIKLYGPGCEKLGYKNDTDPWREMRAAASAQRRPLQPLSGQHELHRPSRVHAMHDVLTIDGVVS